jgi:CheY-like chemotaxis protein
MGSIVIGVTAHALGHERQSALDAGCDAVVPKPYDLEALADALASIRRGLARSNAAALAVTATRRNLM